MSNNIDDDDDVIIPCEFCNTMIRFNQYDAHARACRLRQRMHMYYRDEDDNTIYRIDITPALRLMELQSSSDDDDVEYDEMSIIPRGHNHSSLMLIPRLIPSEQIIIDDAEQSNITSLISEIIGPVHVGLANPEESIMQVAACAHSDEENVCPICQDTINAECHVKTKCRHSYCKPCILEWFKQHVTCPLCNADQRDIQIVS